MVSGGIELNKISFFLNSKKLCLFAYIFYGEECSVMSIYYLRIQMSSNIYRNMKHGISTKYDENSSRYFTHGNIFNIDSFFHI